MAKSGKSTTKKATSKARTPAKPSTAKKAIKKTPAKTPAKDSSGSKKSKFGAPYEKTIKMYQSQGDYFAMNQKYKGL